MMTPKFSLSLIAGVIASALPYSTFAADQFVVNKVSNTVFDPVVLTPSQTDFGGVGLMQMPSGVWLLRGNLILVQALIMNTTTTTFLCKSCRG